MLTKTAQVEGESTRSLSTPVSTLTPQVTVPPTKTASAVTLDVASTPIPSSTPLCDLAQAGKPIDVSVPDDTKMKPGENFTKTWRLVNAGECPWTRSYAVVWFSGDDLGGSHEEALRSIVLPGQSADISVDMVAPQVPGVYQSNWKLRGQDGEMFGIGPGGGSPFWARIEVIRQATLTPTVVLPTVTSTPKVHGSGSAVLTVGQGYDLDTGALNTGTEDDIIFSLNGEQLEFAPQNGAQVVVFGAAAPGLGDCRTAAVADAPVNLGAELEGGYLCMHSTRGLPASVLLTGIDLTQQTLTITYTVWSIP